MSQPTKTPTGDPQADDLANRLANASPEELTAAIESLSVEKREAIAGAISVVSKTAREAVTGVIAATDGPDQPEEVPKLYSFSEAAEFLREHGIDLEAHREDEVRSAIRWGVVDKKDADKYGANFDDNFEPVPEADLRAVVAQLNENPDLEQRIVLAVDTMDPDEAWTKLIDDPINRKYVWNRFSRYQRVNPATREVLDDQRPSGKAGILFTPDQMKLPDNLRRISANNQLVRMTQGQRYMGPVGWMKLFRQGIDRALPVLFPEEASDLDALDPDVYKALMNRALLDPRIDPYLLDTVTGTQFPDYRLDGNANGVVPFAYFSPSPANREVTLCYWHPADPSDSLGGRPVLGSFLS
jgi:hypothetical protein